MQILAIALGGAAGAVFRYWVSTGVYTLLGRGFPYGTLAANVVGCLAMGWLYVMLVERLVVSVELRSGILVGLLGGFTTFSSFSIETLALLERGEVPAALSNVAVSVVFCLAATWAGATVARQI